MTSMQWADLKIVSRSLKNGEIKKDEAFPDMSAENATKALQERAAKQKKMSEGDQSDTPEGGKSPAPEPIDYAAIAKEIKDKLVKKCDSINMLDAIIQDFTHDLDGMRTEAEPHWNEVMEAIRGKREALKSKK